MRQVLLHEMHESPQGQPLVQVLQQLRAGAGSNAGTVFPLCGAKAAASTVFSLSRTPEQTFATSPPDSDTSRVTLEAVFSDVLRETRLPESSLRSKVRTGGESLTTVYSTSRTSSPSS
ncbi:hypothetical protein [Myxococcus landrumensis]|uniref:Uncharacterized protein n=1 Tax=Myxococcus landrumensis TaxID=2813577 RepID=A0ABX7N5Y0_9BACT|nr:hypothetical protein [Myxococcus landrumus]QSQ14135.1 hypothetical protein JY572_38455 [Myxococcus landrumus]